MEQPKTLYTGPMGMNNGGGLSEGVGGAEWSGQRGKKQDNCNSIINKI